MKKINSQRGQSLVELSISLVLLLILLAGAVEFGMAFFQFVQLQDAAQEGALYGSMNPTNCSNIITRAKGASNSPVDLNGAGVTITATIIDHNTNAEFGCAAPGAVPFACEQNGVRVDITYQHKVFMPFFSAAIGSTFPLHASVTDTILYPVCP